MTISNVYSFWQPAEKVPYKFRLSVAQLLLTLVLLTFIPALFFKSFAVAIFPVSLFFLIISMQNLSSDLRDKIPSEF